MTYPQSREPRPLDYETGCPVEIIRRPRCSVGKFTQVYRFLIPPRVTDVVAAVAHFYASRGAQDVRLSPGSVEFTRGSVLGSLCSYSELHKKQRANITIEQIPAGGTAVAGNRDRVDAAQVIRVLIPGSEFP